MTLEYIGLQLCRVVVKSVSLLFVVAGLWLSWSSNSVAATTNCSKNMYAVTGNNHFDTSRGSAIGAAEAFFGREFPSLTRFAGSPGLAGAYLGSQPFIYNVGAVSRFCGSAEGRLVGIGFTPGPLGRWEPAEGGWVYPTSGGGAGEDLPSWEWVLRIKPQGRKLEYEPVGLPFMQSAPPITPGNTNSPSFPAFDVELVLRATSMLGRDAGKNAGLAFNCPTTATCIGTEGYLGSFHDYQTPDTSAANIQSKAWTYQAIGQPLRPYRAVRGHTYIALEASYCKLQGHTYRYWNSSSDTLASSGPNLAFNLPEVLARSFSGVGSVVEAGAGGKGALTSTCVKYDPEQIRMRVDVVRGVPASGLERQGVALGDATDSVGIQLLYSDKADPVDADLRPVDLSAPIDLNKDFLTSGLDYVGSAAFVFNSRIYRPSSSIFKGGGLSFRVRYYQVKPAITAHAISVTYQITQDVN